MKRFVFTFAAVMNLLLVDQVVKAAAIAHLKGAPPVTVARAVQPEKEEKPIDATLPGMKTASSAVQFSKVPSPIRATSPPMESAASAVQPSKA